jgi:molybdopterin converting factor small subunit
MEGRGTAGGDRAGATPGASGRDRAGTAKLRVYAWLRRQRPDLAARDIELDGVTSVGGLFEAVNLAPPEEAIILVNDRRAELTTPLRGGDTVCVFPMLGGG